MPKTEEQIFINYKYALALKKLFDRVKKTAARNKKNGQVGSSLDDSYDKISSRTGLRQATISDAFNGKSEMKASTIDLILSSLRKNYTQFGRVMDKLTEEEILKYKNDIEAKRLNVK